MNILFFGSSTDSVLVADALTKANYTIAAVITQPPKPIGREKKITPTPVETWAKKEAITVLSFPADAQKSWRYQNEETVTDTLSTLKADLLVSASYGQKIPLKTIVDAPHGGLNVHPSILPRWRGGDPVPWAIATGDAQVGVTVTTLADKMDEGLIVAQKKIAVLPTDTTVPLRTKLFELGANLLVEALPDYLSGKNSGKKQASHDEPTARRLTRDDGFEPWKNIENALREGFESERIERKFRAFTPWPGLWTTVQEKRLKILECRLEKNILIIETVQLEGKSPVSFSQFTSAYLS